MPADGRLLMIVQSLYPSDERVRREAEALERDGVGVDVVCLRGPGEPSRESWGLVTAHRVCRQTPKEDLASYLRLAVRFAAAAFVKVQVLSLRHRYRVVQAHNMPDFLIFVPVLQKLTGAKLVLDLHDLSVELLGSKWATRPRPVVGGLVRMVERLSCRFADALITTSEGFVERMVQRGVPREKITLVLNTPDERLFPPDDGRQFAPITRGARLLYHGTVQERFGLLNAVEAVARLQARVPGSRLDVFGSYEPEFRRRLEQRIRDLGVASHVELGPFLPLEDIHGRIRQADIGLVPYLNTDFMNLALSTKTFEYATSGLPIVASRLRSIEAVFADDCVRFARAGDPEDLARQIEALCRDPEARRRQARAARAAVAEISWKVMADRYKAAVSPPGWRGGRP